MATVRTHRYELAPDQTEKFLMHRAELIGQWRATGLDLVETRLYRLEDGTYLDIWRWASDEALEDLQLVTKDNELDFGIKLFVWMRSQSNRPRRRSTRYTRAKTTNGTSH